MTADTISNERLHLFASDDSPVYDETIPLKLADEFRNIARELLSARTTQAEPVAVKPLEWKDRRGDGSLNAFTDFGLLYTVSEKAWGNARNFPDTYPVNSMDEAKAAAQADYETRILSALTASIEGKRQ